MVHNDDASIPVAGRFQRIEEALVRIEEKLDQKASTTDVARMDSRVVALENRIILLESSFRAEQAVDQALKTQTANNLKLTRAIVGIIISAIMSMGGLAISILNAVRHWN